MFLSNRDLRWAIQCGRLIVEPLPEKIGPTSIDLHLDRIEEAKIWDTVSFAEDNKIAGNTAAPPELRIGKFQYGKFSKKYLMPLPGDRRVADLVSFVKNRRTGRLSGQGGP